jgi:hypothetical protein
MKRTLQHPRKTLLATLVASAFVVAAMAPPTAVAQTTTTTASNTGVPVVNSSLVASGMVGVDFRYTATATNNPTKYNFWLKRKGSFITWSASGLTVYKMGVVAGKPAIDGAYVLYVQAINWAG